MTGVFWVRALAVSAAMLAMTASRLWASAMTPFWTSMMSNAVLGRSGSVVMAALPWSGWFGGQGIGRRRQSREPGARYEVTMPMLLPRVRSGLSAHGSNRALQERPEA